MPKYGGALRPYNAGEQRRDVRSFARKADDGFRTAEGGIFLCIITIFVSIFSFALPLGSLILYGPVGWFLRRYSYPRRMIHDMPLRMPIHANLPDGSYDAVKMDVDLRKTPEKANGQGVTYLGLDRESGRQVYLTNSDDRTHMIVVGTTGSGKTEFIFALLLNQLVQNSGFIFVDAKGDINGQRQTVRLARRFARQDDVLTISFATSGRDLMQPQTDKVTNTFNIMASTSGPMLIELLSGMLDDSGGSGGDMWAGRAMAFIAAITRPLTYLRDRGYIQLSPASYIQYMELSEVEKLLFKHDGIYGPKFDEVLLPLLSYIISLPGYDTARIDKGQEQKTNEQFGFITMQLTRAINDLSYNYGHIFGSNTGGDIDIFDVVINRRIMTVLLPSMERAPATLKMLGKLIVGSIKQMMAGSLGNRMEGLTRMTVDSRPTSARNAFRIVLDEWGYIVVVGSSVMPAQARGLGISMVFAAQSYTDIMRGSKEEAEATWDNTTIKVCGRLTSGEDSETYRKVQGAAGKEIQIVNAHYDVSDGLAASTKYKQSTQLNAEYRDRITIDDLSQQQEGEFTLIMAKKFRGGDEGSIAVIRMLAFYTAGGGEASRMYLNDLVQTTLPDKESYRHLSENREKIRDYVSDGRYTPQIHRLTSAERNNFDEGRGIDEYDAINTLFHIQDEVASQSSLDESHRFTTTDIVASRIYESIKQHQNSQTNKPNLLVTDDGETVEAENLTPAEYISDPILMYSMMDMDDAYNEEQIGDSSMSHLAVAVTAQADDDAALRSRALGHVEGNKDIDIIRTIEDSPLLTHSQFADTKSQPVYEFYADVATRNPFMSPEQRQNSHHQQQQAYHDKLASIGHTQIIYCDRPIISSTEYKGYFNEGVNSDVLPVYAVVNGFSREFSVSMFERLTDDVGIIYDQSSNTAISDEDVIYQAVVNKVSTSIAAQKSLFEALTYDYPEKPIKGISDLAGTGWQDKINELRKLGSSKAVK